MNNNLGEFVARGSEGDVYLLEKNKIIKFLKKDKINYLETFIFKHLDCPNINKVLQIEISENNLKFVQEKADYDLAKFLNKDFKKIKRPKKLNYIKQLINAVYFLNSHNIIHGDIKPHNILLYGNILKLNDFGMSKICLNEINETLNKIYTILYRPPECNHNKYCLKSDIWALGCTVYEIYYGKSYFKIDNNGKLYHLSSSKEKEDNLVNKIVEKMLKIEIEERISIEEVAKYFKIPDKENKTLVIKNNLEIARDLDYNIYNIL